MYIQSISIYVQSILDMYVHINICINILFIHYLYIYSSVKCLPMFQSMYLSIRPIWRSTYTIKFLFTSIYVSIYLYLYLSVCPSISLNVYLYLSKIYL